MSFFILYEQGDVFSMKKHSFVSKITGIVFLGSLLVMTQLTGCSKKSSVSATAEQSLTKEKGVFKIALECAYAPYNWTQIDDVNNAVPIADSNTFANGYDVQIAKKIADGMGCKLEVYKTKWAAIPTAILSGKVDAGICGMTVTEERKKTILFTAPYYISTYVALVKGDGKFKYATSVDDLEGAECTSQQSTSWYTLLSQIPNAKILPALTDVPTMLVALSSGKCEVLTCDKPTALAAVHAHPELKIIDFAKGKGFQCDLQSIQVCGALDLKNNALKSKIDSILAGISEKDRTDLMDWCIKNQPSM